MNTHIIKNSNGNIFHPDVEELLQKGHLVLIDTARKLGIVFAKKKMPAYKDNNLMNYIGEIKTTCESMATDVVNLIQPSAFFSEAHIEGEYFQKKAEKINEDKKTQETQNNIDRDKLGDHNHSNILKRIGKVFIIMIVLSIVDVFFNTKAFQVMGDSILFAIFISMGVSFVLCLLAHFFSYALKKARNAISRVITISIEIIIIFLFFIAIAFLRTKYLASQDISISPFYFIVLNFVFFLAAFLASYFIYPSPEEMKEYRLKAELLDEIKKREKVIQQLELELLEIDQIIKEKAMMRIRIADYTNNTLERIRKMYYEAIEVFKITNLKYRDDTIIPQSFSIVLPQPDIRDFYYSINNTIQQHKL